MRPLTLLFPVLALLLPAAVRAQTARWDPPGGTLAVGQVTQLQLQFENCEPKTTPVPPKVDGLTLEFSGQASNISWINGDYSRSITYTFAALLTKKQAIDLPSFTVETNKGTQRVPSAHYDPAAATVGSTGQTLESAASSALEASPTALWAGQVFDLAYRIDAARSYSPDFGHGNFDWKTDPLLIEDWETPQPYTVAAGNDTRAGFAYHTRALVRAPGSYRLNPINQLINLSVGVTGFGFFQERQYQQFSVTSNTPAIEVRPLPPAPAGFAGAVGDFKLVSKVVPTTTVVGEPVTWTVELSGTGNWPDIPGLPAREVSKDFQIVQPKAKRKPATGKLFTATLSEDVVLLPTVAGDYTLDPLRFTYFDPHSGIYKVLETPLTRLTVSAGAPAAGPSGVPAAASAPPAVPELPSGLPRDPLPGPAAASAPWNALTLVSALAAPFAVLLVFWFWLARRRARETDPERGRRESRARLAATLDRLRTNAGPTANEEDLLAWQHDAARLWDVAHAAPMAGAFPDPAWSVLWSEADRALYGPQASLPPDWTARAEAALGAKSVPGFALRQLFFRRNLLPWLSVLVLAFTVTSFADEASPNLSSASAPSAYRRGDFAAAEAGWRADLARDPVDWTTRYNLSVTLAQQNRWDEAAAQAAAAFAQQPANASVRWQFALACEKAGFVPDPLAGFLTSDTLPWLARAASPADWQRAGLVAAALGALALGLFLLRGYGLGHRTGMAATAWTALALAVILGFAAEAGWHAYGAAADSDAAIIWRNGTLRSIPTEVDSPQKTVPLAAGSVGIADKTFLGWVRLNFGNGQTGWVRKEEAISIWR